MECNHQYELGAEIAQCVLCGYIKEDNKELDTDWETKYHELEETNMTMLKYKDDHIHKLNIIQTYLREFLVRQIQEAR